VPRRASADSSGASGQNPPAPDSAAELKARALRALVRREHTRAELTRKLAPHAASAEALDAVLDALVAKGQLSDARYAEVRARVLARKFGALRVRHDLRTRGVATALVEREAAQAAAGELAHARAIVRRRYAAPAATREERARRTRFLQGRGFSHQTIRAALGALDDGADEGDADIR
jgi:regulatory protein